MIPDVPHKGRRAPLAGTFHRDHSSLVRSAGGVLATAAGWTVNTKTALKFPATFAIFVSVAISHVPPTLSPPAQSAGTFWKNNLVAAAMRSPFRRKVEKLYRNQKEEGGEAVRTLWAAPIGVRNAIGRRRMELEAFFAAFLGL